MLRRTNIAVASGVALAIFAGGAIAGVASPVDDFGTDAYPAKEEQRKELKELRAQQNDLNRNGRLGNAIFLHPDGAGMNTWNTGRAYWAGPDGAFEFDALPEQATYRGHMEDVFTGTSNGGATVHAFGYKVSGPGSFGKDGDGSAVPPSDRFINGLSGYTGSVAREAANSGRPVGVINDGIVAEPGTGVFLAEVGNRANTTEIARQMLLGRPGMDDTPVHVIMGGGESDFLPTDTARCASDQIRLDCRVHEQINGSGTTTTGLRTDGVNLLERAKQEGYTVIRTRAEFENLTQEVDAQADYAPKVLGLFAATDTFNDVPEEVLIANGFADSKIPVDDKRSNLLLWGDKEGTPGYNPPTFAEMNELGLTILDRVAKKAEKPFFLISEPESTDNFGNNNNAIGVLNALKRTDDMIGVTRSFIAENPRTLLLTAADSDGGGMQALSYNLGQEPAVVGTSNTNPTGNSAEVVNEPVDGLYGRATVPFRTAPDQFGSTLPFAVLWAGTPDVGGGIVSRAEGLNSELLRESFSERFDSVDVYRMLYVTLFNKALPYPEGQQAPTRG